MPNLGQPGSIIRPEYGVGSSQTLNPFLGIVRLMRRP
jgi:hypothetical protein